MDTTAGEQGGEQAAASGPELISRREFARRKDWAPSYVVKLCQEGRLSLFVACPACGSTCNTRAAQCECGQPIADQVDTRKALLDADLAERELEAARHPEKAHVAARHAESRGETPALGDAPDELPLGDDNVKSYAAAKASREHYQAKLAELDYQRKVGELGDLQVMRRESFKVARQVRDSLMAIPDRLAPVLAAEREAATVHQLLLEEIVRVLNELSRSVGEPEGAVAAAR